MREYFNYNSLGVMTQMNILVSIMRKIGMVSRKNCFNPACPNFNKAMLVLSSDAQVQRCYLCHCGWINNIKQQPTLYLKRRK